MAISQNLQDELCSKLGAVGMPKPLIGPLVSAIARQVVSEGPENVVRRIKVLKQAAVNHIAGQPVDLPWIAHTSRGPKGPWKPVWKWLCSESNRLRVRALNVVMVYASIVLPKDGGPSRAQERKFLGSVSHGPKGAQESLDRVQTAIRRDRLFARGAQALRRQLLSRGWSPETEEGIPDLLEFLGRRYGTSPEDVRRSERVVQTFLGQEQFFPFQAFPQVQKTLGEAGEDWFALTHPWNGRHLDWREVETPSDAIGVIGCTQEPGAKLRAFASPNWVLQAAVEGIKQSLLSGLRCCDWDCTHDQLKGVRGVQEWLAGGHSCFSVDLSDATNNFPLELQVHVLKFLGISEVDVALLSLISRSPFRVTWGEKGLVAWDVGQPLGAGPSFMAFALSHAVVALEAEIMAGMPQNELGTHFYILGDDIVINDEAVHNAYRELLARLAVPVSESKCLQSAVAGEFAGKLITASYVYHGYKYREISDLSFMDVLRNLGAQALRVLSPVQQAYARLVWEIPEPQGLGFNPKGRPLAERYAEYLYIAEALEQAEPDIIGVRPEEVVAKLRYQFSARWWRYLAPTRVERPEPVSGGPSRDLIMKMVRQSDRLVTPIVSGDPRDNPIKGWTSRVVRRIQPVIDKARERWNHLPGGSTPPGPSSCI